MDVKPRPPKCYAPHEVAGSPCPPACGRTAWAAWHVCPPWFFSVILQVRHRGYKRVPRSRGLPAPWSLPLDPSVF
eukprot:138846-Prymnesium_polylepis.1